MHGYRVSIDFTGGTLLKYTHLTLTDSHALTKQLTSAGYHLIDIHQAPDEVRFKIKDFEDSKEPLFRSQLATFTQSTPSLLSLETVGPTIGYEAIKKTLLAALLGVLVILLYILYSFKRISFALGAVVALLHDILVVLGMYSLVSTYAGAELDTLFVTALLTTMSFSVHDTIIIFDTIRSRQSLTQTSDIATQADYAVSTTFVRSLNNSLTIIFMLLALTLLGGTSVRYFAVALLIGTVTGVYSSPFVATPVMIWIEKRFRASR